MGQHLDVSEVGKLVTSMRGFDGRAKRHARTVLQKAAADIKRDAQALAPVDTGNLRASITYETRELASAVTAEVGPTATYGLYVEEGTSTQAPQPYLQPALMRNLDPTTRALAQIADGLFG